MTIAIFCFYLKNRLIQTSQTGGQQYIDTSPFSIPCFQRTNGNGGNSYWLTNSHLKLSTKQSCQGSLTEREGLVRLTSLH
jgi:hypothetical protein